MIAGASPEASNKIATSVMEQMRGYAADGGVTYPEEIHLLTGHI
jgi:hypothetical protein